MKAVFFLMLSVGFIIASCNDPAPRPINYGSDQCATCRMDISDPKYGAEVVTTTGKTFVFDSPECMIEFTRGTEVDSSQVHSLWVTDFINPGTLIEAHSAWYLKSDMIHSPMGLNVAAFTSKEAADRARINFVGTVLRYTAVAALVAD